MEIVDPYPFPVTVPNNQSISEMHKYKYTCTLL